MRIQSIEARNFKLFSEGFEKIKDIQDAKLVLFSGPNGYGKTSVFDVIEFCLTGSIKRIVGYNKELAIPRNTVYEKNILISDEKKDAYVKLCLKGEKEEELIIVREYDPNSNKEGQSNQKNPNKIFERFHRRVIENGEEIKDPADQDVVLIRWNLYDLAEIYDKCCFLSQDENLALLKTEKSGKADALSFLYNIPEKWEDRQTQLKEVLDQLKDQRQKGSPSYLLRLLDRENELEKKADHYREKRSELYQDARIPYQELFPGYKPIWDKEELTNDDGVLAQATKDLGNLIYFSERQSACVNYARNYECKKIFASIRSDDASAYNKSPLGYAHVGIWYVLNEAGIREKECRRGDAEKLLQVLERRNYKEFDWDFIRAEKIFDEAEIRNFHHQLELLDEAKAQQSEIENAITDMMEAREKLFGNAKMVMDGGKISDKNCPLCGSEFLNREELERQVRAQEGKIIFLRGSSAQMIQEISGFLEKEYLHKVKDQAVAIINSTPQREYQKLQEFLARKAEVLEIYNTLKRRGIDLTDLKYASKEGRFRLILDVEALKLPVDEEVAASLDEKNFMKYYQAFYGSDQEKFLETSREKLVAKMKYVDVSYSNYYGKLLRKTEEELEQVKTRIRKLNGVTQKLEAYNRALSYGIQEYKKEIIKDVEPLLHVYVGRILQHNFSGKSIFIDADDDLSNLQLVNQANDSQDILYNMSSGQLSAVAIAFLLCMNKAYAKNKACSLLLIDDPVQTIDDVNMVGLVEILRSEFDDKQIFLSTHEQNFEWYLRYRYFKAGKEVKVFNMKDVMLESRQN